MYKEAGRVLCFGETLWDCFPGGNFPGGAPMNVALHLKKMGVEVSFLSRVGNDKWGDEILKFMAGNGLDTGLIQQDQKHETGKVKVDLTNPNDAKYEIIHPVAWDFIQYPMEKKSLLDSFEVVVFGSLAARDGVSRETLFALLENAPYKVFDVNLRAPYYDGATINTLMQKANMVKMNEEELAIIGQWNGAIGNEEVILRELASKYGLSLICVTRGEAGAATLAGDYYFTHPGFRVTLGDSIGAGDAFLAGFLSQLLKNQPKEKALEFACAAGAHVASRKGGNPDYKQQDIEDLIRSNKNNYA